MDEVKPVSWSQFSKAYLNFFTRIAEFTTELATEAHEELSLPYVDPFKAKAKRVSDEMKESAHRLKSHAQFVVFCEAIRKREAFLRKATDKELEGIFDRLSPAERLKYTTAPVAKESMLEKVERPTKPIKPKMSISSDDLPKKKKKSSDMSNFIVSEAEEFDRSDYSSDDVSLESESESELVDDVRDERGSHKKDMKRVEKSIEKSSSGSKPSKMLPSKPASGDVLKRFTWT